MNYSFKKVFVAACFGMLSFGMVMITIGSLLPELMNKFEMGSIAAGVLTSLLPVGILSGSLLFGPIADRYGYKWLMIISALLEAIGVIG
ncbi:MAG: MFS transporter, partial [Cyclobacteriaceae bacterium]|nr:MFS transporter [Cyclobacteriaceae bacterium]